MSEGLNRVLLLGALGADPELRFTASGQAVLNVRLATSERYKDKSGEWKDKTEWHNVTVWGARAEALGKILRKGSQIFIEGALHTSSYEKNGEKRHKTEINASNVVLCGGKGSAGTERGQGAAPRAAMAPSPAAYGGGAGYGGGNEAPFAEPGGDDSDIPFVTCAFDPHCWP